MLGACMLHTVLRAQSCRRLLPVPAPALQPLNLHPLGPRPPTPPHPPLVRCSYVMLCAPQSMVQQCKAQPALDGLRPAMQLFTAARKLCGGAGAGAGPPTAAPGGGRVGVAAQDLPPAPAADTAGGACSRCSSQSFDPNKVTVQAVQGNCPDPLGESAAAAAAPPRPPGPPA